MAASKLNFTDFCRKKSDFQKWGEVFNCKLENRWHKLEAEDDAGDQKPEDFEGGEEVQQNWVSLDVFLSNPHAKLLLVQVGQA